MDNQELFYPEIGVQIGNYALKKGIALEVCSDGESYFDWAKVRFTPEFQDTLTLQKKDPGSVYLGYDGLMEEVFTGYIAQGYNQGDQMDEILLKDGMLLLEETLISETFLDTTPEEILQYCLELAGVTNYRLQEGAYQPKKVVPVSRKNGIEVLKEVGSLWGIRNKFYFSGGVFYWGTAPEQEQIYRFEFGVNILNLSKMFGSWRLDTVSAPFLRHSQMIEVSHPKLSGTFEVKKVLFTTNDSGFIRTAIWF